MCAESTAQTNRAPQKLEFARRLLYSLLSPAVKLARTFELPLKELNRWAEMAYFHDLRKSGLTLKSVAESLDVSLRKASLLSSQLKENFFDPEQRHEAPRRVEFLLWAEAMSTQRLKQLLRGSHDADEIDQAIQTLLEERRIVEVDNGITLMYRLAQPTSRLFRDQLLARIDGLNHMLKALLNAVVGRFFDDHQHAFARTLAFHVLPEELPQLQELYHKTLFTKIAELDQNAQGSPKAIAMDLAILWAPYDWMKSRNQNGTD